MEVINLGKGDDIGGVISLPEDIIFDVLTRLPAKVLCRFRCICKGWRALISDQTFVAAQKSRAPPLIAGVFRSRSMAEVFELRVMDMDGSVLRVFKDVARSLEPTRLDGLICDSTTRCGARIIDPATAQVLTIDKPDPGTPMPPLRHYGFGRAAPSGAYKLLRIPVSFNNHDHLCEIVTINNYCSEVTWRQRPVPPVTIDWCGDSKAAVNGILYFMSCTTSDTPASQGQCRIATFNLESEEWTETIDGPEIGPGKDGEAWDFALAELKATLNMVHTVYYYSVSDEDGYGAYANIWLLIDSKKSIWVKQYTIQMPRNLLPIKALDVVCDGRVLLLNQKVEQDEFPYRHVLQFYNPSTEALTDFMEMAEEFDGAMAFYTGSLLS
ncbi:unnamed protein product [Urochloa humidicola]